LHNCFSFMSSDRPVLLFQGDSITDAGRQRRDAAPNHPHSLGSGYAVLAASALLSEQPDAGWVCHNRGVGGDKVTDLAARWDADTLSLSPDVLSILVGVNDYWYRRSGDHDESPAQYEDTYRTLLARTRTALPDVTLLLGEPFFVPGGTAVDDRWREELRPYQDAARRIAADVGATWIPYQSVFDEALEEAPGPYWAEDGVHPTPAGHNRMAQAWLSAFREQVA
jgi:lysophospholipase L1-like esterase